MVIYPTNGNPIMALVLVTLSTSQTSFSLASFRSSSLSFIFEQSAKKIVAEASFWVGSQSRIEPKNVVAFIPIFESDRHVVKAVGRAVNFYKNSLNSVKKIEIAATSEEGNDLLENIEQYVQEYFGMGCYNAASLGYNFATTLEVTNYFQSFHLPK